MQLTDFENAAFVVFIVLMTRAILKYNLDLCLPLSYVSFIKVFLRLISYRRHHVNSNEQAYHAHVSFKPTITSCNQL